MAKLREEGLLSDGRRFWVTIGNRWKEARGGDDSSPHTPRGVAEDVHSLGECSRFKGLRKKKRRKDVTTCKVID